MDMCTTKFSCYAIAIATTTLVHGDIVTLIGGGGVALQLYQVVLLISQLY
jgi:hypothetical protein